MAQGAFYVTKTTLDGFEEVRIEGRSVLETYPSLQATLAEPRRARARGSVRRAGGDPGQRREPDQHFLVCGVRRRANPAHRASIPARARHPRRACASSSPSLPGCSTTPEVGLLLGGCLYLGGPGRHLGAGRPAAADQLGRAAEQRPPGAAGRGRSISSQTLGRYLPLRRSAAARRAPTGAPGAARAHRRKRPRAPCPPRPVPGWPLAAAPAPLHPEGRGKPGAPAGAGARRRRPGARVAAMRPVSARRAAGPGSDR